MDTIKRVEIFSELKSPAPISIFHDDSQASSIPLNDGIFTSPPYVGLIDYHEQHRYAYELFNLEDRSVAEIGPAFRGSSKTAQQEYKLSISKVFKNALISMPSGSPIIVVAGDKYNLYEDIANLCGVTTEAIIKRHVNRRTGRRTNEFFESIFIWRKP